jgi:hypothetical protein
MRSSGRGREVAGGPVSLLEVQGEPVESGKK